MTNPSSASPASALSASELCSLLGELGHEVATPLASILLTSEMMLENPALDERQMRQLNCIHQAADETQHLLRRIIQWVRLATEQLPVACGFCQFEDLRDSIKTRLPKLEIVARPGLPACWIDRDRWLDLLELAATFLGDTQLTVTLEEPWLLFRLRGPRLLRADADPATFLTLAGPGQLKKVRRQNGNLELPLAAILAERQGAQLQVQRFESGLEIEIRARLRPLLRPSEATASNEGTK